MIESGDDFHCLRGFANRLGNRADLIERRAERNQAVTRDTSIRRFHSDNAAKGGRRSDRPTRVRTERNKRSTGSDACCGTAAGTARHAIEIVRVARDLESGIFCRGAHSEFIAVHLAHNDGAGAAEPFDGSRSVRRNVSFENSRSASRWEIPYDHVVFYCDWNTGQRFQSFARCDPFVHPPSVIQRPIGAKCKESLDIAIDTSDLLIYTLDHFRDAEITVPIQRDEFVRRDVLEVHLSVMTFGTLNSFTVLPASALPVRGATRSSRTACLMLVTTCGVGSIPETSSSFNFSTYSTMALSCAASSFFSSSATSSIASFATYSTSFSLIFISKSDLLNPRRRPRLVHPREQLRRHFDELFPPDLVRDIHDDP